MTTITATRNHARTNTPAGKLTVIMDMGRTAAAGAADSPDRSAAANQVLFLPTHLHTPITRGGPNMHPITKASIVAFAAIAPLTMTGCLVSSARASKIDGAYVQPNAISKVRVHQSTTTDVENILGQPSSRVAEDDGSELWTWNWTETKGESGAVLLIFSGSSKTTVAESVNVKFVNGIVERKWRD
jgi:hypothetical protein